MRQNKFIKIKMELEKLQTSFKNKVKQTSGTSMQLKLEHGHKLSSSIEKP